MEPRGSRFAPTLRDQGSISPAGEVDVHRFPGAQVACPGKLRADQQGSVARVQVAGTA
jgi:hypothetical protein